MEGEMNILLVHPLHQQAYGFGHQQCVGCLHRNHDIVEPFIHGDTQVLHAGLHHPLGCITIAGHDAIGERPVIHAYTNSGVVLLADFKEWHHL